MRWDNLLAEKPPAGPGQAGEPETPDPNALPRLFAGGAVIRTFKTPEFRGMTFYEIEAKSILNHVKGDRFGFNHTINPYRGCSHSCSYCFARPTHEYLDLNTGTDFETKIVVKVNAVELLRRELRKPAWAGGHVAMGTNTDPYQRAEGHYKLMRGILAELNAAKNPYSILTKGTLIQRDLDLLLEGRKVAGISTNFSIGTVDEEVWRKTEPGTPHPMKRIEVVKMLNEAGIPCGVLMAPILPGISDSPKQLQATVRAIADAGATHISPIILHLRPGVREVFLPWLEEAYPHLIHKYEALYNARSSIPKTAAEPVYKTVSQSKARYARPQYNKPQVQTRKPSENPKPEPLKKQPIQTQLSLDLGTATKRAPSWVKSGLAQ